MIVILLYGIDWDDRNKSLIKFVSFLIVLGSVFSIGVISKCDFYFLLFSAFFIGERDKISIVIHFVIP